MPLFVSGFVSATLLPGSSEILFSYVLLDQADWFAPLLVVTLGNWLGAIVTFIMGGLIARGFSGRYQRWLGQINPAAVMRVRQWGGFAMLLSWLPVVGDALVLAGGFVGLNIWFAGLCLWLGKLARYSALVWLIS